MQNEKISVFKHLYSFHNKNMSLNFWLYKEIIIIPKLLFSQIFSTYLLITH